MHRQQWLQRNQAVQVVNVYAEAMSGGKRQQAAQPQAQEAPKRKSPIMPMEQFIKSQGLM